MVNPIVKSRLRLLHKALKERVTYRQNMPQIRHLFPNLNLVLGFCLRCRIR